MVSADVIRLHLAYHVWASERLVEAASKLAESELNRDFGTADKSIAGTLGHIYAADRIWMGRLDGAPPPAVFICDADRQLSALENRWPAVHARMIEWGRGLTGQACQQGLVYSDLRGRRWEQPVWQIVLHVVNHGSHHRGQVSGFLRTLGQMPPGLDLITFYRELGERTAVS